MVEWTSIRVSRTLAKQLHEMKEYGQSNEDIIWELLIEAGHVDKDPRKDTD